MVVEVEAARRAARLQLLFDAAAIDFEPNNRSIFWIFLLLRTPIFGNFIAFFPVVVKR